ncbi:hypothetical protein N658DRAFT_138084 [Parathielavia hyrcaniae]|uniref:Uncharacterized protein n=1 Tax=Parathielavia hyrcaniae TaxID=113614 RepID=A0AAN6Q9A2_9PEZI|nr:hypothetical protein N658DRAFT_138084 [Parathielavia hyrcaniae]
MATRFEKLDKQLDRLGELFSKMKRSADSQEADVAMDRPATPDSMDVDEYKPTFEIFQKKPGDKYPEPSFIRPTSSRMEAREEVLFMSYSTRRARSLPESPSLPRLAIPEVHTNGVYTNGNLAVPGTPDSCPPIPPRYSSLYSPMKASISQPSSPLHLSSSRDDVLSELMDFSFSTAATKAKDGSPSGRRLRPVSKSPTRPNSLSGSPMAQVDRKRSPRCGQDTLAVREQEQARQYNSRTLAPSQQDNQCLMTTSPRYPGSISLPVSVPESGLEKPDAGQEGSQRGRSMSISMTAGIMRASEALHKSASLPRLLIARTPSSRQRLKEPSLTDFLALSDDDIADGQSSASKPPSVALPPHPAQGFAPRLPRDTTSLLTLSPPLASRPLAAAAFEAARIATKYQFDLVYVVNLWPSHMSRPTRSSPLSPFYGTPIATSPARSTPPSPPATPVSHASGYGSGFESRTTPPGCGSDSGMSGRLLAAYGLQSIEYPFRICVPVHQKVLRTQGWLEYRDDSGSRDVLARGYSCSFCTGYSPARGPEAEAVTTPDGKRRKLKDNPPNRGIVFAAFRKPHEDGTLVCSDANELAAIHKDAEALVDMLIDMDKTHRQRRAPVTGMPRRCVGGPKSRLVRPRAPLAAL